MFLQSAVDSPVFAWDWILHLFGAPLCRSLGRAFPTMIDPLDTAANYLDAGRLDDGKTIFGTILNAKLDESSARYLMARAANARKACGRAPDYLAGVENPELAHLYVEAVVAHRGLGAYRAAVRAAQQAVLLGPDGYQTLANLLFHGDNYHQVLRRMHPLTFASDQNRRHEQAVTIPNQWDAIKIRLRGRHL